MLYVIIGIFISILLFIGSVGIGAILILGSIISLLAGIIINPIFIVIFIILILISFIFDY